MSRTKQLDELLSAMKELPEKLTGIKEIFLTNVVMVGELPSPTFVEEARIKFLCDRFTESGLLDISVDEKGNGVALYPGTEGKKNILLAANADSVFTEGVDHTVSMGVDAIDGVGLSDNALGIATLASLPYILDKLGIQFKSNLLLTGATRTLGVADMEGFNFFLDHVQKDIDAAVVVRGGELGRLSYSSYGSVRGEIKVAYSEGQGWHRQNFPGAIVDMEAVLHKILSIPVPQTPKTVILLGSIHAGASFSTAPSCATLQFEVRSEDAALVKRIERDIDMVVAEVHAGTTARVTLRKIGRRAPGSLPFSHPMVQVARDVVEGLGLKARMRPSSGLLSSLLPRDIPSITVGLTDREAVSEINEVMRIEPLFKGLAQIITLLQAIDEGFCHEQD